MLEKESREECYEKFNVCAGQLVTILHGRETISKKILYICTRNKMILPGDERMDLMKGTDNIRGYDL